MDNHDSEFNYLDKGKGQIVALYLSDGSVVGMVNDGDYVFRKGVDNIEEEDGWFYCYWEGACVGRINAQHVITVKYFWTK